MPLFKKFLLAGMATLVAAFAAASTIAWHWAYSPLNIVSSPLDVTVQPRSSLRSIAQQLQHEGVPIRPQWFILMTRVLGLSAQLKSGNYTFSSGITPYEVLQKVARGDVNQYAITLIEGWTFEKMRAQIDANPALRHDSVSMSRAQLLQAITTARPESNEIAPRNEGALPDEAEGLFFPDTYLFDKNTSDLDIYRRAYRLMQLRLKQAWDMRAPNLPYRTPYDMLKMASIIEKETGHAQDRAMVAAVFVNRLRLSMPLQTDPSVIYGLGKSYTGRLRKRDLQADTPYNTYTRGGLPPTPISLPGYAALDAARHPATSAALYFVARHDGSSHFSNNLNDHNKAVNQYIRGQ